jgi:hypothetical protein
MKQPEIKKIKSNKSFLRRLITHWFSFELLKNYRFSFYLNGKKHIFIIPKGFIYDGATIPWYLWKYLNILPIGKHNPATIIHDFIYETEGHLVDVMGQNVKVSRTFCDDLYRDQLLMLGYPIETVVKIRKSIKVFGFLFWREL